MKKVVPAIAVLLFLLCTAHGEQFKRFGDWHVHYIAFNASILSAEVAERYEIVRGRNKGLVNIHGDRTFPSRPKGLGQRRIQEPSGAVD